MVTSDDAVSLQVLDHGGLSSTMLSSLRALFDEEYLASHGEWDPEQPYGYAPHDHHMMAFHSGEVIGHVGWGRRRITVGHSCVTIAGVGGVLVSPRGRGLGLGSQLMAMAAHSMRSAPDIDFGYLGCNESVVAFYESCKWQRIRARERCVGTDGVEEETAAGPPLLILPIGAPASAWPSGDINLHGRPW